MAAVLLLRLQEMQVLAPSSATSLTWKHHLALWSPNETPHKEAISEW